MFEMESQNVAKKSRSVLCEKLFLRVAGKRIKRVVIAAEMHTKNVMSSMKTTSPIVSRPRNRYGVADNSRANPPVDMVRVYHAQVKWRIRSRIET